MNILSTTFLNRACAVLSAIGFIYSLAIGMQVRMENRLLLDEGLQSAQHVGKEAQATIENTFRQATATIEEASRNLVELEISQDDHQQYLAPVRKIMYSDPGFVEAGVAFMPFAFDPQIRLHGFSYVVGDQGMRLRDLDNNEDYTKPDIDWYHRAIAGQKGWLDPVYDETQHKMLVTYTTPLFKADNPGVPAGAVYATYAVSNFKKLLENMNLGDNGYSFLLSPDKRFIAHYNKDYLDHRWSLDDFLTRLQDDSGLPAVTAALEEPSRTVLLMDPDSGQEIRLFFLPIPGADWTLGIILNDRDMLLPPSVERVKLLRLVLVFFLSVFLLSIPLCGIKKNPTRGLWILSNVFTVCCIASYVAALGLTTIYPPDKTENTSLITNQNFLNRFMSEQRHRILEHTGELPLFIPTGIYVQSVSYDKSRGSISTNGYLWQRYTQGIHDGVERGFMMPGSISFELEEPNTTRFGNTELVRWDFKTTLFQDFDFSRYPFSREYVQIQLRHKQFTRNIILVPDLDSYKIINPAALPGLKNDLYLRGWDTRKSYFGYKFENYKTSFGLTNDEGLTDFPDLFFTIEISKQIFGAIISHLLPLVVVAILLFALMLLSAHVKVEKREIIGSIAACAGFFIVIVFSHVGLRESFVIKDIIYLEYYYYIIYALILLTVANYVTVGWQLERERKVFSSGVSHSDIFRRRDLYAKMLFWPFSQLAILVLTLLEFY